MYYENTDFDVVLHPPSLVCTIEKYLLSAFLCCVVWYYLTHKGHRARHVRHETPPELAEG